MASDDAMPALFLVLMLVAFGTAAMVGLMLVNRAARVRQRDRILAEHYLRLGRIAPEAPCPCGSGRVYFDCCRNRDVVRLRDEVIDMCWRLWAHKSYPGRRRASTLKHRLEDHPLPRPALPPWVEQPEAYRFPIPDEVLRAWRPSPAAGPATQKREDDSVL